MCCGNTVSNRVKYEITFSNGQKIVKNTLGQARIAAARDLKATIKELKP